MRDLLTTQSQSCYREQIQKEMLTRLAWKSRYAELYPSCCRGVPNPGPARPTSDPLCHGIKTGVERGENRAVLPPVTRTPKRQSDLPPPPPPPPPEGRPGVAPTMRPASPQTRLTLYRDSSHHGRGRSLYLRRRGQMRPEEKFEFPLLSSWEYGWRLGDYALDYGTPTRARSSVVKNTFYSRNGVFSSPSATDRLG